MTSTAGLVLAAGAGRRFGGPKAPAIVDGERLVDRSVRVLREGGCEPIVVVLGAWLGEVEGADVVVNENWDSGMGSSLRTGLLYLQESDDIDRVVVTLVDLPDLTGEAVARLASCNDELCAATFAGERGHPVLMSRAHWKGAAVSAIGDKGARQYLSEHNATLVEVGDIASGRDLDFPRET